MTRPTRIDRPLTDQERRAVEAYLPLVHAVVRRVPARGEYDDLVQQATFGVVRALRTWHTGFVCSERTWVWRCVASAVRDAYRVRHAVAFVPLEDEQAAVDDTDLIDAADALARFARTLRPREQAILAARAQGREMADIGAELGVTDTRVSQIVRTLRERYHEVAE